MVAPDKNAIRNGFQQFQSCFWIRAKGKAVTETHDLINIIPIINNRNGMFQRFNFRVHIGDYGEGLRIHDK